MPGKKKLSYFEEVELALKEHLGRRVKMEYIQKRITGTLSALPVKRVPHFVKETEAEKETETQKTVLTPQKMCIRDRYGL